MSLGENGVSYTVKELLDRIDRKVESIDTKLDHKADRDRVHDVSNRIAALELLNASNVPALTQVTDVRRDVEDLKTWRNRVVGAVSVALFLGAAALARAMGVG